MSIHWGKFPEYDAALADGVRSGTPWAELAESMSARFGVEFTDNALRFRSRRIQIDALPEEDERTPEERMVETVRRERDRAADRALAREMQQAVRNRANWEEFLDIVRSELGNAPRTDAIQPLVVPTGAGTPETMVVLVGDVHIGKLVDPNVVGEGFGYGIPIFEQRMAKLEDRIYRLHGLNSQTAPIERIRLYFLGDGVDGTDMRRGHAHRNDIQTATGQCLVLTYAMEAMVRRLTATLGIPVEIVWEFGNHGRVGEFGVNLPADNWDFIAGQMLGIALRDKVADGSVRLHADTLKYSITQLGPLRVHSSHGDGIKGGDGFAGLPINGLARALAKDTGLHLQLFDLYLTAHFHTPQDILTQTGRIIMNGAWDGGDDYSINQLKAASDPVQWAFGIHPTKGMTWQARINLSPARRGPSLVTEL